MNHDLRLVKHVPKNSIRMKLLTMSMLQRGQHIHTPPPGKKRGKVVLWEGGVSWALPQEASDANEARAASLDPSRSYSLLPLVATLLILLLGPSEILTLRT